MKNLWKNLIALCLGCLVAFGMAEVFFRLYEPVELRLRGNKINLIRNKTYMYTNGTMPKLANNIIHIKNAIGFRGSNPPPDFDQQLTVLTVGGSTTESFFVSEGQTWTDQLGLRLKKVFQPLWINNAGLDGHSTFGHLILMRDHILKLQPRVILFLVGINDQKLDKILPNDAELLDIAETTNGPTALEAQGNNGFWQTFAEYSDVFAFALNLSRYTQAVMHAHIAPMGHMQPTDLKDESRSLSELPMQTLKQEHAPHLKSYRQRVTELVRMSQESGIEPILVTQTRFGGGNQWFELELYNEVTREVGKAYNLFVIDLGQALRNDPLFYYDYIHYTEAGSEAVANVLYQQLCPYLETHYSEFLADGYSCKKPNTTVNESVTRSQDTLDLFDQAVAQYPDIPDVYVNRGMVYLAYYKDSQRALSDFEKALSFGKEIPDIHVWKGLAHLDRKQYLEAISEFSETIQYGLKGQGKEAYDYRAQAYAGLNRTQDALNDYSKAIQLSSTNGQLYYKRAEIRVQLGRYVEAIHDLSMSLKYPSNVSLSNVYFNRAGLYFELAQFENAVADYSSVIQIQPNHFKAYVLRGVSYLNLDDNEKGCSDLTFICSRQTCGDEILETITTAKCNIAE